MGCVNNIDPDSQALALSTGTCLVMAGCLWAEDMMTCAFEACPDEITDCLEDY